MRSIFKHKTLLEIFFIFLLSLTPLLWFKPGTIIVGHDNVFALDPVVFLTGRLSTWIEHGFGQSQDFIMGTIPIHLIDAIPYMLGFPLQATEITVYVFWFFLIGISAYIFARQFFEQSWVFRLLVVILYQFNFFLLQGWWIGERTKFSAYIALPLILTVFLKARKMELGVTRAVVLNSLILFVFNAGGLYGISLYGGLFIALLVFLIFFGFFDLVEKNFASIKRLLLITMFSVIGYILVSSYFILPAATRLADEYTKGVDRVGGVEGLLDWTREISANTSLTNLFRLQGIAEWYDNSEHPYASIFLKNPLLIAASFIWPFLVVLALTRTYKPDKQKFTLFFFLIFLVGIFLSSGTHRPFEVVYEAFMKYIPGFAAFRSPYFKFAGALFFAVSFLIAFYLDSFKGRKKYILFILMAIFVFVYHFPYFTGDFFSWRKGFSTRLIIPTYVAEFGEWLEKEKNDDSRVLFLPPNSPNWRYSIYDWGYLSFQSLPTLFSNKSTVINNDRLNEDEHKLIETLYDAFSDNDQFAIRQLSAYLGIKYFLVQEDTIPGDVRSSFSQTSQTYRDVIEQKLQLPLVEKFGRWSLYALDTEILPLFYAVDDMTVISGPVKNFSHYYDFLEEKRAFLKSDDFLPDIYSPRCLKCIKKDRPFIDFPERNILPDSPFYPLLLLSETQRLQGREPESLVYDYLGLSLKRLSEMNEMIEKFMPISGEILNRYEAVIRLVHANFNKLSRLEDKYSVADDLTFYIRAQRDLINKTLGEEVSGLPAIVLERALVALRTLEEGIQPYVVTFDITQNRLFAVNIAQENIYSLYIRSREFEDIVRKDAKISIQIDGKEVITLPISDKSFEQKWFFLGNFALDAGEHTVLLSFSELENKVSSPQPAITVINPDEKQRCFTTKVQNYDNRKRYKAVVYYKNDLYNDINVYVWEEKEDGQRLRFATQLFKSLSEEEFTHEISPQSDIRGIVLGFCSTNITESFIKERFTVKINELIEPIVLFVSGEKQNINLREVSYEKINPTKYSVSFSIENPNSILVFNSRFDRGWELEEFNKNHIFVNGFANGWIIDKSGQYSATLTYKPQNTFHLGGLVSFATVIGGIMYLLWEKTVRYKRK